MTLLTASIHPYRTKKGTRYAVRWREGGRQRHETVPGYGRQAKEIARERASEIELGRHYVAPPQSLGAFLHEWLERQENHVKPSTLKRKREALRALGVLDERAGTMADARHKARSSSTYKSAPQAEDEWPSDPQQGDAVTTPKRDVRDRKARRRVAQPLSAAAVHREAQAEREPRKTSQPAPEHGGGHIPSEEELDRLAREAE